MLAIPEQPANGWTLVAKGPRLDKGKGKGKDLGRSKHGSPFVWNMGYKDLVWTPELQEKKDSERSKESSMAWALYKAVEMQGAQNVTLSQLGSDCKVAELKKDMHFRNWRLLDILREYEDVFELTPSAAAAGGMLVRLQPGAEAALPDADTRADEVSDDALLLPERIDNPRSSIEKVQALRIELLHAVHRRGGKCAIQELGQEPRLQEKKKLVHQAKKLVDWVKVFPDNFEITSDGQQNIVELVSTDVKDMRVIEKIIRRDDDRVGYGSRGRADSGSHRGRDRSRSRDRGRDRYDRHSSGSRYGPCGSGYDAHNRGYPAMPPYAYGTVPPQVAPPPGYGVPPPAGHYGLPGQGYPPHPGYQQAPGYGAGQPSQPPMQMPAPGYQQPSAYTHPPAGYQPPPAGYQQPAGYQSLPASFSAPVPAGYPPQAPAGYPPHAACYHPAACVAPHPAPAGQGSGYPPPQVAAGYPPAQHPPAAGYPPPTCYPALAY